MKFAKSTIAIALLSAAAGFVAPAHATANQVVVEGPNDGSSKPGNGNLFVNNVTPYCLFFAGPKGTTIIVRPKTQSVIKIKRNYGYRYEVRNQRCGGSPLKDGWAQGGALMWHIYEDKRLPKY